MVRAPMEGPNAVGKEKRAKLDQPLLECRRVLYSFKRVTSAWSVVHTAEARKNEHALLLKLFPERLCRVSCFPLVVLSCEKHENTKHFLTNQEIMSSSTYQQILRC